MKRVKVKSIDTGRYDNDSDVTRYAQLGVQWELERKRILNQPVAKYDPKTGKAYLVDANGTVIKEVGHRITKGRYSEWAKGL